VHLRTFISRNSDLWLASALIMLAVCSGSNAYPRVRFDRERIEVWAVLNQIQVSGLYHYRNPSRLPALLALGLPFPVDAKHPRPSSYFIATATEDGRILKYVRPRVSWGEVRFRVLLLPHEEKWIRIDYIQGTTEPQGKYILSTTRRWRHPLQQGDYLLHLGPGLHLVATNLLPYAPAGNNTYTFTKVDFYPAEDWTFTWQGPAPATIARRNR